MAVFVVEKCCLQLTKRQKEEVMSLFSGPFGVHRGDGMKRRTGSGMCVAAALCTVAVGFPTTRLAGQVVSLDPAKMARIGTVDGRFQSYNIEMVEVIGGRFWKPYGSTRAKVKRKSPPPRRVSLRQA